MSQGKIDVLVVATDQRYYDAAEQCLFRNAEIMDHPEVASVQLAGPPEILQQTPVAVIGVPADGSLAHHRNALAQGAVADHIIYFDADSEPEPGSLATLLAALEGTPDFVAYSYCPISASAVPGAAQNADTLRQTEFIPSACSLIRTAAWRSAGIQWDESLLCYQPWDIWLSFLDAGYTFAPAQTVKPLIRHWRCPWGINRTASRQQRAAMREQIRKKHGLA